MITKENTFKKQQIKTKYSTVAKKIRDKKWFFNSQNIVKIILYIVFLLALFSLLLSFILYKKYIVDLPSVTELENLDIAQSSTIYDREWNELYKIFKENRTYIGYDDINQKMVNAIVAGEDKRFWDNPWFDLIGLSRAVLYRIIWKTNSLWGTSTLTQQLIRNTIIENRSSAESFASWIERKIKEIYLSYKLTNWVTKEKILELYLNKIAFWSNAYGIEQAAQTFFWVPASDLDILESSILASLPKWPSYYSPYNHYDRLVWYPYTYTPGDEENSQKIIAPLENYNFALLENLRDFISWLKAKSLSESKLLICGMQQENFKANIDVDSQWCNILNYSDLLRFLNSIRIWSTDAYIEYQTGRKDFILWRMLEDNYISFDEYKSALLKSILFEFNVAKDDIKYPHLVFYVKDYLEEKYGQDILESGGFQIYTTIDPELQDKAEEIIETQVARNLSRFNANNAAMLSLDNENGEILAMVGWVDYFNKDIGGNNNMMTAQLQPWSTFKPFVYSLALSNNKIGSKTPIYDLETEFPGGYIPANFDGEFLWKMDISTALNNSRNIPAIKMFYLAGKENKILKFMTKLWVQSLETFKTNFREKYNRDYSYGSPLALGTGEMSGIELARAYSVFANMGELKEFTPILKIIDSNGVTIQWDEDIQDAKKVIDENHAYLINNILSDSSTRPEGWNSFLTLPGRPVASKTGTSTKQYNIWWEKIIFPRNLWTVSYTPQITSVAWAWNTDGTQLWEKWNGLEWAGSIVNQFMKFAHKDKPVKSWTQPNSIKNVDISILSWLLPSENSVDDLLVSSLFINEPITYDNSFSQIEVDAYCNGIIWKNTPVAAIKDVNLLQLNSLRPDDPNWEKPVQDWLINDANESESLSFIHSYDTLIFQVDPQECERPINRGSNIKVRSTVIPNETFRYGNNYIEVGYKSNNPIIQLDILLDNDKISEIPLPHKTSSVYVWNFYIPDSYPEWNYNLSFRIVDNFYESQIETKPITLYQNDTTKPKIIFKNLDTPIELTQDSSYKITGNVIEKWRINSINILLDWVTIERGIKTSHRSFHYIINQNNNISPWNHILTIQAVDDNFNIWENSIEFTITQ